MAKCCAPIELELGATPAALDIGFTPIALETGQPVLQLCVCEWPAPVPLPFVLAIDGYAFALDDYALVI